MILQEGFTQSDFDSCRNSIYDIVGHLGGEDIVEMSTGVVLMEGYWDIDDEGQTSPHFWYNKQELDKRNINY